MKKPRNLMSLLAVFLMLVMGCNAGASQPMVKTLSNVRNNVSGPEGSDVNFAEGFIQPDDEGLMQGFNGKVPSRFYF